MGKEVTNNVIRIMGYILLILNFTGLLEIFWKKMGHKQTIFEYVVMTGLALLMIK